jgi:sugar/nucleoside kinase (ribokinase family)
MTGGHDLVVLGDLVADLIIPIERLPLYPERHSWAEGIFVEPGGAGNVLVAARRIGLDVASLGNIGGDRYGEEMRQTLAEIGVDVSQVEVRDDRETVLCLVLSDTLSQHVYLGVKDNRGLWSYPESWHEVICKARALYTDGYTLRDLLPPEDIFAAFATARTAGATSYFDPGPSVEFIPRQTCVNAIAAADVLLIAEPEARYLFPEKDLEGMTRSLLALGTSVVVLKLGDKGCLIASCEETIQVPGFPVNVVDTVGAGDSFAAAFIAGRLRGGSLRESATLANAMGALVATQRGAGTRIPPREQLLDLLADFPAARVLAMPEPELEPAKLPRTYDSRLTTGNSQ